MTNSARRHRSAYLACCPQLPGTRRKLRSPLRRGVPLTSSARRRAARRWHHSPGSGRTARRADLGTTGNRRRRRVIVRRTRHLTQLGLGATRRTSAPDLVAISARHTVPAHPHLVVVGPIRGLDVAGRRWRVATPVAGFVSAKAAAVAQVSDLGPVVVGNSRARVGVIVGLAIAPVHQGLCALERGSAVEFRFSKARGVVVPGDLDLFGVGSVRRLQVGGSSGGSHM